MATITGTAGNDVLVGANAADVIYGLEGDDWIDGGLGIDSLFGGEGNDKIYTAHNIDAMDGGPGVDTAVFARQRGEHILVKTASGFTVYDRDSEATYIGIERFWFTDRKLAFDLGPTEAAGLTVRVLGAAFDAPAIGQRADWVGLGLQYFDGGRTLAQVCEMVAQVLGLGDADFVSTLYANVVGVAPDAAAAAPFIEMLRRGTTQGQLLELAAMVDLNAAQIDLVGLQDKGVAYTLPPAA